MKKFFSWVMMAILYYLIGFVAAIVIELGLAAAFGYQITSSGSGLIIVLVLTIGLIMYGTRKQK